jgi:hypothetical protein
VRPSAKPYRIPLELAGERRLGVVVHLPYRPSAATSTSLLEKS